MDQIRSKPLPLAEYKLHIQRLYDAVEHLFAWLKRISLSAKQPPGTWIQNFIEDVMEIGEQQDNYILVNRPLQRIRKMRRQLDIDGFAFRVTRIEDTMTRIDTDTILIGLYFPPGNYQAVNGKFPSIMIMIGSDIVSIIQTDGTKRLYKPFGGKFWLHNNISGILFCSIDTGGRPYYLVEIIDPVNIKRLAEPVETILLDRGLLYTDGNAVVQTLDNPMSYSRFCNDDTVLSYPYVRAMNIIKRAWTRYRHRKRLRSVNLELTAVPGLGVDALELQDKYADGFKFI